MLLQIKRLIPWLSILLILIIMVMVGKYQKSSYNRELLENAAYTSGQFTGEILQPHRKDSNGPCYICHYEVNGKMYTCYELVRLCKKLGNDFFDQKFPVIYDSTNPELARVLVFPFEYEELNLKFPDSLNWILNKN